MFDFYKNWMEFFFFALIVIGIAIALSAPSPVVSYAIIFISGMFAGRLIYKRKNKLQFPYFIIIAGFVIGYLIGVYYGSRKVAITIILFLLGAALGYYLYNKKFIKDAGL